MQTRSPDSSRRTRRVVVIGGGVAGSLVAKTLQFGADLTLIDPKDYFEIPWARLRSMVEPSVGDRSLINHRDYLTNGRAVTSRAIKITDTEVLTAEGRFLPYDYLVIATGHNDVVPTTKTERLKQYDTEFEKIKSAKSILIVGGGPVGVELASEIAADFPEKKITLVHNGPRLLEFIGPKAADKTLEWFRSKHVEIKLGQTVDLASTITASDGTTTCKIYKTTAGETISADCHFLCTGTPVASEWLNNTILKDNMDKDGRLVVDQFMRVKGRDNVFAIGDITNVPEPKQGYLAQKHAVVAAKNIKLLMDGGKESKMVTYEPRPVKLIVSLGRRDAVAQFSYTTLIGMIPGMIKSKDLFVGKTRKLMGLKPNIVYS